MGGMTSTGSIEKAATAAKAFGEAVSRAVESARSKVDEVASEMRKATRHLDVNTTAR